MNLGILMTLATLFKEGKNLEITSTIKEMLADKQFVEFIKSGELRKLLSDEASIKLISDAIQVDLNKYKNQILEILDEIEKTISLKEKASNVKENVSSALQEGTSIINSFFGDTIKFFDKELKADPINFEVKDNVIYLSMDNIDQDSLRVNKINDELISIDGKCSFLKIDGIIGIEKSFSVKIEINAKNAPKLSTKGNILVISFKE